MPTISSQLRLAVLPGLSIALAIGFLGVSQAGARANPSLMDCAARDRQILMMLEERETNNRMSSQAVSEMMLTIASARMNCYEGRVLDALALYDEMDANLSAHGSACSGGAGYRSGRHSSFGN